MAEIVSAVGTCLCTPNCITTPVVERCKYVINPTKHIRKLLKQKADIVAHKDDVIRILHRAGVEEGKKPSNVVTNWLKDVDEFLDETSGIEEQVKETRRGMNRLLPNCCSRSTMGSNIARLLNEAREILEKIGNLPDEALTMTEERRGIEFPPNKIVGESTAHKTIEMIWSCLKNDKIGTVGVLGMGGVGKTAIATEINNRLQGEKLLFDKIIWVTVSQSTSVRHLQVKIASELNLLPLDGEDEEVSGILFRALKQRKKVVIILDDMWEEVSLQKIGIPEPTEENGCKILLTTRKLEVCRKMGCNEYSTIRVKLLSEDEAWELFMNKVGVELSEEVRNIAKSMVNECACLPLAIITVGGAMRGIEDIIEWRVASKDLLYSKQKIFNMETNVFKCLKFSYDRLPDENVKKCFLYCALFPEDWYIVPVELIDYWIMGGLIECKDSQDEIDQGQSILNKLRDHCLLGSIEMSSYGGFEEKRVSMHDLIRDMALQFTSLVPSVVKAGVLLKELPNLTEWREDLESASFMNNEIEEISISPRCPKLSILLLNSNRLCSILEHFFMHMQGLRVLDLSKNEKIKVLPDSISDLVNLRALHFRNCTELKTLPSLSKLKLLRILDLRRSSNLESLPESISECTNLLALRLSGCTKLKWVPSVAMLRSLRTLELNESGVKELPQGIEMLVNLAFLNLTKVGLTFGETSPSGFLSALSSLEVLSLEFLELETLYAMASSRGIVEDLLSLKHLHTLAISFPSFSDWAEFVGSPNYKVLKKFRIVIGDVRGREPVIGHWVPDLDESTSIMFFIVCGPVDVPYHASFLPQNTRYFNIEGLNDMISLNELRCLKDVKQLRSLAINSCDNMEYIKHEEEDECTILQELDSLFISNCLKLHSVYKGILRSAYCLTYMNISGCHNLKNVFSSPRLLQQLQNLDMIDIDCCDQLEEIIQSETTEGEATDIIALPKLRFLQFKHLPKLKNIWRGEMVCDSFKSLKVKDCPELKRIPTFRGEKQSPSPLLQGITGSSEWWDSLEWDYPFAKVLFQPYYSPERSNGTSGSESNGMNGYSYPLCSKILDTLQRRQENFHLRTLFILGHNTRRDSVGNTYPIFNGFMVETCSGTVSPANFDRDSRCPDEIVRRVRVTVSSEDPTWKGKLLEIYDTKNDQFQIAACSWTPRWKYIASSLQQFSDLKILQQCSTSPLAEGPDFVDNERRLFNYFIKQPNWRETFPMRKPRVFERSANGGWTRC